MGKKRSRITLKRLISKKQTGVLAVLNMLSERVNILDASGLPLVGEAPDDALYYPVELGGETLGQVVGSEEAAALAALLSQLAEQAYEKRQLAGEVLDMYREINLLYGISEKIAAVSGLEPMAQIVIDEAGRLIEATGGAVMALDAETGVLNIIATFGKRADTVRVLADCEPFICHIVDTGKGEIINNVAADPRFEACEDIEAIHSLVAAPLKAGQKVLGVLTIHSQKSAHYTAADLKLLAALASQTAPVIEHALAYEAKLREAQERERALQEQINRLRVQVDERRMEEEVRSITETEYFQQLEGMIDELRDEFRSE